MNLNASFHKINLEVANRDFKICYPGAGLPACALPLLVLEFQKGEFIVSQVTLRHRPGGLRQLAELILNQVTFRQPGGLRQIAVKAYVLYLPVSNIGYR